MKETLGKEQPQNQELRKESVDLPGHSEEGLQATGPMQPVHTSGALPTLGLFGRRLEPRCMDRWFLRCWVPVALQWKTAHCGTDEKEPGGAIATCGAAGAGEGADAGVHGTAPGGGSEGNRARETVPNFTGISHEALQECGASGYRLMFTQAHAHFTTSAPSAIYGCVTC